MTTRTRVVTQPAVTRADAQMFAPPGTVLLSANYSSELALECVWTLNNGLGFIAWGAPNSEEWPHTVGNPF